MPSNKLDILITADGTQANKALKQVGATASDAARSSVAASKASALAAKFAGDAVTSESQRILKAKADEKAAYKDFVSVQSAIRKGYLDEATGAQTLGAALQRLTAAQRESAAATKTASASSTSFMTTLKGLAATLGAGMIIAKLKDAVSSSMEFGEQLQRASEKTGVAVGTLSTLHYAAAITGGDFDTMSTAIGKMGAAIGNAADGNDKKANAFLKSLGLNAKELASQSDGAEVAFKRVAQQIAATESPVRRLELAQGLLGKTGKDMIPTLIEIGSHWDEWKQKAIAAGVYLDGPGAESLAAASKRFKDLQQRIQGAEVGLTEGMTPALTSMLSVIEGGKSQMQAMQNFGSLIGKGFALAATEIYAVISDFDLLAAAMFRVMQASSTMMLDFKGADWNKQMAAGAMKDFHAYGAKAGASWDVSQGNQAPTNAAYQAGFGKAPVDPVLAALQARNASRSTGQFSGIDDLTTIKKAKPLFDYEGTQRATNEANAKFHEQLTEQFHKDHEQEWEDFKKDDEAQKRQTADYYAAVAAMERLAAAQRNYDDANIKSIASMAELVSKHELDTGAITKHAAAMQEAAAHAAAYQQELAALVEQYRSLSAADRQGAEGLNIRAKIVGVTGEAERTAQTDQYNVDNSTMAGGLRSAINEFIAASKDAATQMRNLVSNTLKGLNEQIVNEMMGKKTDFKQVGQTMFKSAASASLEKGEGAVMSALGLGKLGTSSNPMHVIMDDASKVGGILGGAAGATVSKLGGFFGSLLKAIIPMQDGGYLNGPALVGENGPELFMPSTSGHIVPNYRLNVGDSGGTTHNWNIDARGSSNPSETEAAVQRGIARAAPQIVAASVAATQSRNQRIPGSRRG
jgi:hypothetical protein